MTEMACACDNPPLWLWLMLSPVIVLGVFAALWDIWHSFFE